MYATVTTVDITAGQFEASRKVLKEEVVPRVSKAPGFVKGFWSIRADAAQGLSFLVFDTKQNAENAAQMLRSAAPPPGVKMNDVEIREVIADA
jgi:hypothetical protein